MEEKTKRELLASFFENKQIRLRQSSLFEIPPPASSAEFDRVEGMLLGLAIGDALGRSTEGQKPAARRKRYGEIRDYLSGKGLPSDDTQLAFWTLEQILGDGEFVPEKLAALFCQRPIFGMGQTVAGFRRNYKAGLPWYQCGPHSAGNGALMRIAPVLLPHLRAPSPALWVDTALCTMLTHNDAASLSACLAFVSMLWSLLGMRQNPPSSWWKEAYVEVARELEGDEKYRPRGGEDLSFAGPLWRFVEQKLGRAQKRKLSSLTACQSWFSGAFLLETVPSVLYILTLHADSPEEALVRAINDTKDNDTIGAIVGAAVGALHGKKKLPARWIENLSGRTQKDDDDKIFSLLEQARKRWSFS